MMAQTKWNFHDYVSAIMLVIAIMYWIVILFLMR